MDGVSEKLLAATSRTGSNLSARIGSNSSARRLRHRARGQDCQGTMSRKRNSSGLLCHLSRFRFWFLGSWLFSSSSTS